MSLFKKAEKQATRLKLLVYGKAGTGKTITGISFPSPVIVDGEQGTNHYGKFKEFFRLQTTDVSQLEKAVDELLDDPQEFKSFIIDPFSIFYNDIQEKVEKRMKIKSGNVNYVLQGLDYRLVNKRTKQLLTKLLSLDCNVIVTTKEAAEYANEDGNFMKQVGVRPDGPKDLPHYFDVVLHLSKKVDKNGKEVFWANVEKDRTNTLPPEFEYSYESFVRFMGVEGLEREPVVIRQQQALEEIQNRKFKIKLGDREVLTAGVTAINLTKLKDLTTDLGKEVVLTKLREDYFIDSFLDLRDDEAELLIKDLAEFKQTTTKAATKTSTAKKKEDN